MYIDNRSYVFSKNNIGDQFSDDNFNLFLPHHWRNKGKLKITKNNDQLQIICFFFPEKTILYATMGCTGNYFSNRIII